MGQCKEILYNNRGEIVEFYHFKDTPTRKALEKEGRRLRKIAMLYFPKRLVK